MVFFEKIRTLFSGLLKQNAVIETSLSPERVLDIVRNSLDHRVVTVNSPFYDQIYPFWGSVGDEGFCVRRIHTAEERMFRNQNAERLVVADGSVEKTERGSRIHICMRRYGASVFWPILAPALAVIGVLGGALKLVTDDGTGGVALLAGGIFAGAVVGLTDGYTFKRECKKTLGKLRELLEY